MFNYIKSKFSVCPICGNIIHTMGENFNSCCGISLPALEADSENEEHIIIQNSFVFGICNHQILNENQIPAIQLFVINQDYWKSI